ncbi:MAG: Hsp20/alpha crystallin family protein [Desulfobacteraceae bacterium]|nr:MAG: Hsp20/alpha crystallin family protein [Desulfobacteraceae bacterium]
MNIVKFNPRREMGTFSDRVNRLFDGTLFPAAWLSEDSELLNWRPVVDIFDNDEKIVIKAELPGVDKKDIHVDVKDGILTLSGERSYENEVKEENYHRKERAFGKFHRSFTLPDGLNTDKIDADYKDGVLKIEIPKPEEKKPKKIAVH